MTKIININVSRKDLTENLENLEEKIIRRLDFLLDKFWNVPIYLVNEALMDSLYPPRKTMVLNKDCTKKIIDKKIPDERKKRINLRKIFKEINEECREDFDKKMIAIGLYIPKLNYYDKQMIEKMKSQEICDEDIPDGEAIFICPERVEYMAQKYKKFIGGSVSDAYEIIFQKVLIHEIAHAYMHNDKKFQYSNELWYEIIEESMANAVAFKHFSNIEQKIIHLVISNQSLEYRGYLHWITREKKELAGTVLLWKNIMQSSSTYQVWHNYYEWYYRLWKIYEISKCHRRRNYKIKMLNELALEILKKLCN